LATACLLFVLTLPDAVPWYVRFVVFMTSLFAVTFSFMWDVLRPQSYRRTTPPIRFSRRAQFLVETFLVVLLVVMMLPAANRIYSGPSAFVDVRTYVWSLGSFFFFFAFFLMWWFIVHRHRAHRSEGMTPAGRVLLATSLLVFGSIYVIKLVMGGRLLSYDSALARFMVPTCHPKTGVYLGLMSGLLAMDRLNSSRNRREQERKDRDRRQVPARPSSNLRLSGRGVVLSLAGYILGVYLLYAIMPLRYGWPLLVPVIASIARKIRDLRKRVIWIAIASLVSIQCILSQHYSWEAWKHFGMGGGVSIHDEIVPEEMRKAAELYAKSWHWNPLSIGAAIDAGDSHYHLKEYEQALSYYERALRVWPWSLYANYGKAKCFRDLGRYDEMVASLHKARLFGFPIGNRVRFSEDFAQFKDDPAFEAFESEFR